MEEGKAFPVGRQTTAEIFPALNFMNSFIADQLFKDGCRRVPVDMTQFKETTVKPAGQQMLHIGIERFKIAVVFQNPDQGFTHIDNRPRATRCHIDLAQKFLTDRFGRLGQSRKVGLGRVLGKGLGRLGDFGAVGTKVVLHHLEEGQMVFFWQAFPKADHFAGNRGATCLAFLRDKVPAHGTELFERFLRG